jgi:hypothetical protein
MNGRRRQDRRLAPVGVMALAIAVLLSACGGGTPGGSSQAAFKLHTLILNATPNDIIVGYEGDGTPAPDQTVKTCTAELIDFPLADPFKLTIDGRSAIDTEADLPAGLPNQGESDLILEVNVASDGTISLGEDASRSSPDLALKPGRQYTKPATSAVCPTLPG